VHAATITESIVPESGKQSVECACYPVGSSRSLICDHFLHAGNSIELTGKFYSAFVFSIMEACTKIQDNYIENEKTQSY